MQCATATPFGRLAVIEQQAVFDWLIDGGHVTRTGKPLERPRPAPIVKARTLDGQPIYEPGTDFSTHDTVRDNAVRRAQNEAAEARKALAAIQQPEATDGYQPNVAA